MSFDFSVPATFDGVLDQVELDLAAPDEPGGVVAGGEEL
jgi:hypothetical protein